MIHSTLLSRIDDVFQFTYLLLRYVLNDKQTLLSLSFDIIFVLFSNLLRRGDNYFDDLFKVRIYLTYFSGLIDDEHLANLLVTIDLQRNENCFDFLFLFNLITRLNATVTIMEYEYYFLSQSSLQTNIILVDMNECVIA
jgi:hypothetical protein